MDGIVTDVRLAFGSVAPTVRPRRVCRGRPARTDRSTRGRSPPRRAALARDIAPIDDIRSTARYRLTVAGNVMEEFLLGAS